MNFQYPVAMVGITQYFSKSHPAIDLGYKTTKDVVYSCEKGTVIKAGKDGATKALFIVLDHGEGWFSTYWHLASYNVKVGEKVKKYQKLGIMGNTGNATGIHLHFELLKGPENTKFGYLNGKYQYTNFVNRYAVDPTKYCYLYSNQTKSSNAAYTKGVKTLESLNYTTTRLQDAFVDVLKEKAVYYRTEPSLRLGNTSVVGLLSKGQKGVVEKTNEPIDNFYWVKLQDGFWVALIEDYTVLVLTSEVEQLQQEIERLKEENARFEEKIEAIQTIVNEP